MQIQTVEPLVGETADARSAEGRGTHEAFEQSSNVLITVAVPTSNKHLQLTIADSETVLVGGVILHLKKDKTTNKSLRVDGDTSLPDFGIVDVAKDAKSMVRI